MRNLFAICLLAIGTVSYGAQPTQKVVYPDGTVRYEPVPTATTAKPSAPTPPASCACQGGTDPCVPACKIGLNIPEVKSHCPPSETKCTPFDDPHIDHNITTIEEKIPFYKKCYDFEAIVPIPVLLKKTEEICRFKTIEYKIDCCTIKVCVPCEKCVTTSKVCEIRPSQEKLKIRVCIRYSDPSLVDVYVLNAPGLPAETIIYNSGDRTTITRELQIALPAQD